MPEAARPPASAGHVDFPGRPEAVRHHAVARRPERLGEGQMHLALFRKRIEYGPGLVQGIERQGDVETLWPDVILREQIDAGEFDFSRASVAWTIRSCHCASIRAASADSP